MNRRNAIRTVVIISAGAALLPSCRDANTTYIQLKNISFTGKQQEMLADLSETIIPKTKAFAGAKDLKAPEFVLLMLDDCTSPDDQQAFTKSMSAFEDACRKKWDNSFNKCSSQQKIEFLKELESKTEEDDAKKFYKTVKRLTVQAFTSSKEYLEGVRKYKIIPGSAFKGCVPVNQA
jgi:hypothetical protein